MTYSISYKPLSFYYVALFLFALSMSCKNIPEKFRNETTIFNNYLDYYQTVFPKDSLSKFIILPSTSCEGCEEFILQNLNKLSEYNNTYIIIPFSTIEKYNIDVNQYKGVLMDKEDKVTKLNLGIRNLSIIKRGVDGNIEEIIRFNYENVSEFWIKLK